MSITLNHVSYIYHKGTSQEHRALSDISLQIEQGEFVGVMGHTGCGKTTLIQLMAGLLNPTEGQVLLDGRDIAAKDYPRAILPRKIGIVFQYPECQLFASTVEKDVAFGLKHSGLSREETAARVRWALELMQFSYEAVRFQSPLALSGGEKRRVAIAGVLAARPCVLIFDEPIAGLDPYGREAFLELAMSLCQSGTTILMVSHNADAIAEYAGRLLVLQHGRLAADDTPRRIFTDNGRRKQLGLTPSAPAQIAERLRLAGKNIPPDIVRYRELLSVVKSVLCSKEDKEETVQ